MPSTDLITSYLALYPSIGEALDSLNQSTGRHIGYNRLSEWRSGKRSPTKTAINHMILAVTGRQDLLIPGGRNDR